MEVVDADTSTCWGSNGMSVLDFLGRNTFCREIIRLGFWRVSVYTNIAWAANSTASWVEVSHGLKRSICAIDVLEGSSSYLS